ncbi:MAG: hypothetical protein HY866_09710 [Chloroflexi bacterium]|nr:hypothetical protein [Chloroflexota bacterium]
MYTRKEVLQKLAQGEIDVTRATELLSEARDTDQPTPTPVSEPADAVEVPSQKSKNGPRWLRIHVSDLTSGKQRVKVNVPLGLVSVGLKIGARFTDEVDHDVMHDVIHALEDKTLSGTLVEVEDVEDNERVHIFID